MINRCPNCHTENRPTAKFCHQCGQRLTPAVAEASTSPDEQVSQPTPPRDELQVITISSLFAASSEGELLSQIASPAVPLAPVEPIDATLLTPAADNAADETLTFNASEVERPAPSVSQSQEIVDITSQPGEEQNRLAEFDLPIGAVVALRFHVTGVIIADDGASEFLVEDHGVCRSCGMIVQATDEEPYCFECGAHLLESAQPWPTHRLRSAPAAGDGEAFEWQGQVYELLPTETPSATGEPTVASPFFGRGVSLLAGQRSDVGLARAGRPDEDSIFSLTLTSIYESIARPTVGLYVVADGMGGHGEGEIASRLATDAVSLALIESVILPALRGQVIPQESAPAQIDAAIQTAHQRVLNDARARHSSMGTTVTLALVVDEEVYIANVGDSRTYLWRGGMLMQLSEDHSAVYHLYRQGMLTEEELYNHPRRNEIDRCLGCDLSVNVDHFRMRIAPGDLLLLCCDGLWEMLHNDGIADVLLAHYGDPQAICDELVKRANLAGGDDNISVIVVKAAA